METLQREMLEAFLASEGVSGKAVYAQVMNGLVEICYGDGAEKHIHQVDLLDLLAFVWGAAK
jgi:hypothetical protein